MAVRNFWVEADIDGYKTKLKGGPRNKNGGMKITLYQRREGEIVEAVSIYCHEKNGVLTTDVFVGNGFENDFVTKR